MKYRVRLPRPTSLLIQALLADRYALIGAAVVSFMVVSAAAAPLLTSYDPTHGVLGARLLPPFWLTGGTLSHPLGTDPLGRDVLTRILYGARMSLAIGALVVLAAFGFGGAMGIVAGYSGGRTEAFIMRWVETQVATPGLLLSLIILSALGSTPLTIIAVLSLTTWPVHTAVLRGIVLSVRQSGYVEAAIIVGCRPWRIAFRHILPNILPAVLTLLPIEFARILLSEAALSFLGLGVQPPAASWGFDIAAGRDYLFSGWWLIAAPGLALTLTVLGVNLVANWLQTITDPRLRQQEFATISRSAMGG